MQFSQSTLISAIVLLGATVVNAIPTNSNPPPTIDCTGDQVTQCNSCIKPGQEELYGLALSIPILGDLLNRNCIQAPALAGNSCAGQSKICCVGGNCSYTYNGVLNNICIAVLGPCSK